jgi:hypothetical protein
MAITPSFPTRDVLRRPRFSPIDVVVFVAIALLLFGILRLARSLNTSSATAHVAVISTDPANLPYYAARSLLRMFIAFFLRAPLVRAIVRALERPRTAPSAGGFSWTFCGAGSARTKRRPSLTPPLTGAVTVSCSNTAPAMVSWSSPRRMT